jgi:hypothetical protein
MIDNATAASSTEICFGPGYLARLVALTPSLVGYSAMEKMRASPCNQRSNRSIQVSLSFLTIFFPALVCVSNNENRAQKCAGHLVVTLSALY